METSKPKVLIIDDDPIHADTLAMVLNISGFTATVAYSGAQGLELARESRFECLVTDVMMAEMSGIEAAIAIRQVLPQCRILLISGSNDTTALLAAATVQGHDFEILAKPVHPTVMLERLRANRPSD